MKTIISMTIAASVPALAYFGFTLPNEGMLNVAHTMAWVFASLSLLCLLAVCASDIKKELAKKPVNKIERFFNRASHLVASIVFVFYGSIATGIAALFCVLVAITVADQIKSTGE